MSIVGGLVVFSITWIIVLFTVLPWGIRTQEEEGDVEPGTVASAPASPAMWKKFAITTLVTIILFGTVWASDEFGWIDYRSVVFGDTRN